jgi:hypothetical protein
MYYILISELILNIFIYLINKGSPPLMGPSRRREPIKEAGKPMGLWGG